MRNSIHKVELVLEQEVSRLGSYIKEYSESANSWHIMITLAIAALVFVAISIISKLIIHSLE